jgi:hypothetical protein
MGVVCKLEQLTPSITKRMMGRTRRNLLMFELMMLA